ncbi:MAG: potassium-transporting ATPase subunit KdpB, partial [Acidimicrobiia bacterium]
MAGSASKSLFEPAIVRRASRDAFVKLDPRTLARNPVMLVVEVGSVFTTFVFVRDFASSSSKENVFAGLVAAFLWFTVLFANFAEAVAEGRGKAQADTLRRTRQETVARRRRADGSIEEVSSSVLDVDDVVLVVAGEVIPSDGEVVEGIASVDESAITGESAPVIREAGGDRSSVTGGTTVLSDEIAVRITARAGETFLDRMIALVEGTSRQKTPNEIALSILLAGLTLIFLLATVTLQPFAIFADAEQNVIVLVALLVCLIPTTIGGLLSAIGIAGMDRLVQRNVLAMSGRAVEAAGDCATLLLDKTGTITFGARQADAFVPAAGVSEEELADAAQLSSLADETPEGRSIVALASDRYGINEPPLPNSRLGAATMVAFTAQTRMSGVDLEDGRQIRKGAADSVRRWVEDQGGIVTPEVDATVDGIADQGGTPLVVATAGSTSARVLGVIYLKDIVKPGIAERFADLRRMGIRTVMITGDNPRTASVIAKEAGVDDFLAEATPEDKMRFIRSEQTGGRLVAMTGDGTNDAPALAQADVAVAMNTGTQAAKEAGNMVDLDSDPAKLI